MLGSFSTPPLVPGHPPQKQEETTAATPAEFFIQKPAAPAPAARSPAAAIPAASPTLLPPPPHRGGETAAGYDRPPFLLPGHPREGQTAVSLLGGKYLLLEEMEGASLHRCVHLHTNQEYVCKVCLSLL